MEVKKPTQYVYVAKIVDHMDQYLEYYHKIALIPDQIDNCTDSVCLNIIKSNKKNY